MSQFQLVVVGILMALALVAVLIISGVIPGLGIGGGGKAANINIWGTIPFDYVKDVISNLNEKNRSIFNLNYVQKDPLTYESELVDALAAGRGPDVFLLPQDLILKHKDKVLIVPFTSFPKRTFKDTFIGEGELFLSASGVIAFPLVIDPIVLYWNRDLFANAAISRPPKTWNEFEDFVPRLTIRDSGGNIIQAGAAFGEFQNIDHAKDIISLLMLQAGNPIVDSEKLKSTLKEEGSSAISPAESALMFFTEFSDPLKTTYSWNRSLANSRNSFIAGTLAIYFGYASEYKDIASKNPHLNFDIDEVPQIKDGSVQATFARMYGLAVSKTSANAVAALNAVYNLTNQDSVSKISQNAYLPPGRRDLLSQNIEDPALSVFYKSAIKSRAWLEPDPQKVSDLFSSMIENVITGKKKISDSISDASQKLDTLLKEINKQQ
jgi:ABC-type glycerol-3-phosphate transport system substrate-binding protein